MKIIVLLVATKDGTIYATYTDTIQYYNHENLSQQVFAMITRLQKAAGNTTHISFGGFAPSTQG
jgi:hypothetical protein